MKTIIFMFIIGILSLVTVIAIQTGGIITQSKLETYNISSMSLDESFIRDDDVSATKNTKQ